MTPRFNATVIRDGYESRTPDDRGKWIHVIAPDGRNQANALLRWFEQLPDLTRVVLVDGEISDVQVRS